LDRTVIGTLNGADSCDVDVAYAAAQTNQRVWAQIPPGGRADVFHRAAGLMTTRRREIEDWLVREAGYMRSAAANEWQAACHALRVAAALPFRFAGPLQFGDFQGVENHLMRRPVGVVGIISPYSAPLYQSVRLVASALALGNAVVVKPSDHTPVCGGLLLARLLEEAGLPPGVLNVVVGADGVILTAMVTHSVPKGIAVCGEAAMGQRVQAMAATSDGVKAVLLDLQAQASLIITEDVDLDHAVVLAVRAVFWGMGPGRILVTRVIVAAGLCERFVDRFVDLCRALKNDDPEDALTAYGPVISRGQLDDLRASIAAARAEGALLRLGGRPKGLRLPPQVMDRVTPAMAIAQGPLVGPVALIFRARDDEDAVCIANGADHDQSSAVLCRDVARAVAMARRLEVVRTVINGATSCAAHLWPLNGGSDGTACDQRMIEAFTAEHWITVRAGMDGGG
jgi:aldehyde dehydrogenase (NAD+)